jgi:hypothetical protein
MATELPAADPAPSRVELHYRVEAPDYAAFLRKVRWSHYERTISALGILGAGFVGWIAGMGVWVLARASLTAVEPLDALLVLTAFGALTGVVIYAAILYPTYTRSLYRAQPLGGGETVLIADAVGVSASVGSVTTATPWRRIVPVETDTHLFLFFSRVTAHIVPKRDLPDADAFAAFVRAHTKGGPA